MFQFLQPGEVPHLLLETWQLNALDYLTTKGFRKFILNRDGTTRQNELPAPQTEDETILDAFDDNYHKALAEIWMLLDPSIQNQVLVHMTGPAALWNGLANRFAVESAAVEIRRASNTLAVVRLPAPGEDEVDVVLGFFVLLT